ncbi:MAG TPA: ion channel [Steroidobacteraceae bacterium]|nr:ion channel [Steroidobacteraceae bacterium]
MLKARHDNNEGARLSFNRSASWLILLLFSSATALGATPAPTSSEVFQAHAVVFLVTTLIVVMCVVIHYEILSFLTRWIRTIHLPPRRRILILIFSMLAAHVLEIWIFGAGYFGLTREATQGELLARHPMGILDYVYFSAVSFTTLGLGDIAPIGPIRFMAGTESLTGFVLITWSGAFTFMEMQRFWKD